MNNPIEKNNFLSSYEDKMNFLHDIREECGLNRPVVLSDDLPPVGDKYITEYTFGTI